MRAPREPRSPGGWAPYVAGSAVFVLIALALLAFFDREFVESIAGSAIAAILSGILVSRLSRSKTTESVVESRRPAPLIAAEGDGAVVVGRDMQGSIVATGPHTVINVGKAASASAAASTSFSRLYQLPPPPADFTGRGEELAWIKNELSLGGATITGFQGMGGVGKTALVLKVASEVKDAYPDGQIYFNLRGVSVKGEQPATVTEALSHVLRSFHPDARLPETDEGLQAAYRTVLHGKKVLLVMDNAREAAQIAPLLLPAGCVLMVTSRWNFTVPGLRSRDLNVLLREESVALLQGICGRIADSAVALAEVCGDLPVALRLAGSALAERKDLGVGEYLDRLRKSKAKVKLVAASLGLSYDLLDDDLKHRWRYLSVFPESFERLGAGAVCRLGDEADDTLGELVRFSLVEWDDERKRYRLHDLARDYAGSLLGAEEREEAGRRHAEHYLQVLAAADDLYLEGGDKVLAGLAMLDTERVNVVAGQAWAAATLEEDETAARLASGYPNAGAYVLDLRLHPREKITWLESAVVAAQHLEDRQATCGHLNNLGLAWAALGDARKAIEYCEKALVVSREIGDRRLEGNSLGNLGLAWAALGDARKAIEYHEKALVVSREIGDRRLEGNSLGNLGLAWAALGDARKAIEYHEKALVVSREIGDRRGEGNSLGNLGNAWADLGDARKAIEYYEKALVVSREIGDRRGEGNSLGNLGLAWAALGDARKAIEYHEKALVVSREIGDRRLEGNSLGNLGLAWAALGDARKAIEYHEKALVVSREIGDRRGEGQDLGNLGNAWADLGDARKAIEYHEKALVVSREIGDRRGEGQDLGNLGNAWADLGDARKAIEYHEKSLVVSREIGDRRGEGNSCWNMAVSLRRLDEADAAIVRAEQALAIFEAIEDPNAAKVRAALDEWRKE